jgi:hypothetical protein
MKTLCLVYTYCIDAPGQLLLSIHRLIIFFLITNSSSKQGDASAAQAASSAAAAAAARNQHKGAGPRQHPSTSAQQAGAAALNRVAAAPDRDSAEFQRARQRYSSLYLYLPLLIVAK